MSERDGFTSGFLVGAVAGSLVGGVIGTLLAARLDKNDQEEQEQPLLSKTKFNKGRRSRLKAEESIEVARRSLEDKIAQLNTAIDDVRQQLGTVNGNPQKAEREQALDP
ncbi:MAG: hypothetical protein WA919_25885 [Coleofasciculaceae cyanobacterium]